MEKDNKIPVYTLVLKDDAEESGVNYVALVDSPAIELNWLKFNKQLKFKADPDRKIITGCLMVADLPIYRRSSSMGEFYVVFTKDQIEMMAQKFMKQGFQSNVNLMHEESQVVDGVTMFESFIVDSERGVKAPAGFEEISEGSWFGSYKVENDKVWTAIKEGEFLGFSVEGMFDLVPQEQMLEKEIIDIIKEIHPEA